MADLTNEVSHIFFTNQSFLLLLFSFQSVYIKNKQRRIKC